MTRTLVFENTVTPDDVGEIQIVHSLAMWEEIQAEIEALRAKIEKAEAVIEATVHLIDDYGYTLGKGTEEVLLALKEYGEPNTQKPQTHSV